MSKNIKDIVGQVEFYLGKYQSGFHSPDIIVRELNTESLNLFKELMEQYANTRQISEFLRPFLTTTAAITIPGTGLVDMSLDENGVNANGLTGLEHVDGIILEDGTEVEILENAYFITRLNHPNKAPSSSYPICRMRGETIEFSPKAMGQKAIINFIKAPTKAQYAFTVDGDDYVYSDDDSVDWEWSQQLTDRIVLKTLSKFGINIKDGDLINYSQLKSQ